MQKTIEDIVTNCRELITDSDQLVSLLENNPKGGGMVSIDEFVNKQYGIHEEFGVNRMILFGPFWNEQGRNINTILSQFSEVDQFELLTWDSLILNSDSKVIQQARSFLRNVRSMMFDEIPQSANSDTRASYYYALESLYVLIHLYNTVPEFKDLGFTFCLAEQPFSGYHSSKYNKSPISISAIEIRTIIDLLSRKYSLPPIFFVTGVFQETGIEFYGYDLGHQPAEA